MFTNLFAKGALFATWGFCTNGEQVVKGLNRVWIQHLRTNPQRNKKKIKLIYLLSSLIGVVEKLRNMFQKLLEFTRRQPFCVRI